MSVLPVLQFPHPLLRRKSRRVEDFGEELAALADALLETMYVKGGIGLAAPQVGQLKQLVVVDLHASEEDEQHRAPRVYVNPAIVDRSGETLIEEGCLSVPEFTAEVKRAQRIVIQFRNVKGEPEEEALEDLAAGCLQHELDHLLGKLFLERLPPLKRQMVKKRLAKLAQSA